MDTIIETGRLTADPVKRTTSSGKELADFTIAVDRGWGENKSAVFIRCTAWEAKAAPILQYLHRGDMVNVSGKASATAYIGKDGKAHASLEIKIEQIDFLPGGKREEPKAEEAPFTPVEDPDLPF